MLGIFLTDEVVRDSSSYREWALDLEETDACGNIIFLDKVGNNVLISYDPVMNPTQEGRPPTGQQGPSMKTKDGGTRTTITESNGGGRKV